MKRLSDEEIAKAKNPRLQEEDDDFHVYVYMVSEKDIAIAREAKDKIIGQMVRQLEEAHNQSSGLEVGIVLARIIRELKVQLEVEE